MSDLVSALEEFGLPGFLRELNSVLIALLDRDGRVLAGNCGFLRLMAPTAAPDRARDARNLLINPRLEDVRTATPYRGGTLLLYRGVLDIAGENGRSRSLQGHIYRWGEDRLLVAAEFDVEGLEMLGATVLRLNEELAETQRRLLRADRELKRNESVIQELMNTDPLTGVGNRRRLNEALAAEIERSRRHAHPFCLLIADLDHFKNVNEQHGYAAGDEVLRSFAVLLREHSRQSDQVARFGGEEFVLLLPDTVLESAVAFAERIRQRLEWQPITPRSGRITASFGVAMLAENEKGEELLQRADLALHRSKREGRNRITQTIAPGQNAAPNVSSC